MNNEELKDIEELASMMEDNKNNEFSHWIVRKLTEVKILNKCVDTIRSLQLELKETKEDVEHLSATNYHNEFQDLKKALTFYLDAGQPEVAKEALDKVKDLT